MKRIDNKHSIALHPNSQDHQYFYVSVINQLKYNAFLQQDGNATISSIVNRGSCSVFIRVYSSCWAYTPCTPMSFDFNVPRTYHKISPYRKCWKRHTFNLWYSLDTSNRFTGTFEKKIYVTISNPHPPPTILKQKWFKNFSHINWLAFSKLLLQYTMLVTWIWTFDTVPDPMDLLWNPRRHTRQ